MQMAFQRNSRPVYPAASRISRRFCGIHYVRPTEMALLLIQLAMIILLPALLIAAALPFVWREISRRWLFVMVSLLVGYSLYFAIMYFLDPDFGRPSADLVSLEHAPSSNAEKVVVVRDIKGNVIHYFLEPYLARMITFTCIFSFVLWRITRYLRREVTSV